MKLIVAIIQPHTLPEVKTLLFSAGVCKMTIITAMGCGQQKGHIKTYRGIMSEVKLLKKIRLEIAVNEKYVQPTVDMIITGARMGKIGDGKIMVMDLPECIRIRTGERGPDAIG